MIPDAPNRPLLHRVALAAALAVAGSLPAASFAATPTDPPPALKNLQAQGLHLVGPVLPAPKGMTGWAAWHGRQPVALYVAADGQVVLGTLFDAQGRDMTQGPLAAAVMPAMSQALWAQLEHSHWIADGPANAGRVVYMFIDPNCPYCNQFWKEARPWVKAGKVQLRYILVGIITSTSDAKAAAVLASKDPLRALDDHERAYLKARRKGGAHEAASAGIAPLDHAPSRIRHALDDNLSLMLNLGVQGTPGIAWRDASGKVRLLSGAPDPAKLQEILGPL